MDAGRGAPCGHGYLLTLHVLLLCAAGRTPTEIATFLFCSRSSVYRIVHAYHVQRLDTLRDTSSAKAAGLSPSLRRSLVAMLRKVPSAYGWCRTRWSCATLTAQLTLQRGIVVSASTMRRYRKNWDRYLVYGEFGVDCNATPTSLLSLLLGYAALRRRRGKVSLSTPGEVPRGAEERFGTEGPPSGLADRFTCARPA
jgi:transposase